jgi:hypothetical protein
MGYKMYRRDITHWEQSLTLVKYNNGKYQIHILSQQTSRINLFSEDFQSKWINKK